MEFSVAGDACVATVRAEIDIANSAQLEAELQAGAAENGGLIVVLSNCSYMDSSGLRVLIRLANARGAAFGIVAPQAGPVRRVLDVTGLAKHMAISDSLAGALARLGAPAPAEIQ
ncbi:MAG TPA: STAS domain-containing protein [Candidatus Baltobacteraceae bacterium]|nr:STAS domain-containing protein [Candidatus Baltobacteraceae bacterium]